MGSDVKKAYGAEGRDEMLWFDPSSPSLVDITDENCLMYDERIKLQLDEAMVRNIMHHGVRVPIIVRKNGDKNGRPVVEIVDGKQRKAHAIEANKRLVAEGKEPIRLPAVRARGEVADMYGIMISANEIRRDDSIGVKARKLQRYLAMGRTEAEAAVVFGVTLPTVKNMLAHLELHPDVQKRVESENLPSTVAKELGKLPQEEQPAALAQLVESGNLKGAKGVPAAKNVSRGQSARTAAKIPISPKVRDRVTSALASAEFKALDTQVAKAVVAGILFASGDKDALGAWPRVEVVATEALKKPEKIKKVRVAKPKKEKVARKMRAAKKHERE
jgi:ParB family chromosome partitioning protein